MVGLKPESSGNSSTNQQQPSSSSVAEPIYDAQLNGHHQNGEMSNGSLVHENGSTANSLRNGQEDGEWESFEVHYTGRGISSFQANGNESDSSFVSDSDDDQYEGYEQLALQTLQTHGTDSDESYTDSEMIEEQISHQDSTTTPRQEQLPEIQQPSSPTTITVTASNLSLPTSSPLVNTANLQMSNDIPLDQESVDQIKAAMSDFVLPSHPNMPNDIELLEMIKRLLG